MSKMLLVTPEAVVLFLSFLKKIHHRTYHCYRFSFMALFSAVKSRHVFFFLLQDFLFVVYSAHVCAQV